MSLHPLDLSILTGYLGLILGMGWFYGRRVQDVRDYFLSSRQVPWWAVLGSIVATETSTVTFLSVPAFAFAPNVRGEGGNWTFLSLAMGTILGRGLVTWLFLPAYFRGELFTVYQLLEQRFNGFLRRAASLMFVTTRSVADGLRLMATAWVLVAMTEWKDPTAILMIGTVTILYTWLGGMRAVIWTDVVQLGLYLAGGMVAAWVLWQRIPGGWETVVSLSAGGAKFQILDFRWDWDRNYTFWAGLIGGAFLTLATHGTDQMMVQRYLCARDRAEAARAVLVSGLLIFVQFCLFLLIGSLLAAFYVTVEPLPETVAKNPDRVFAHFLVTQMPVGFRGLVVAAVFAAAMSTLSSSLNSLATASFTDFGPRSRTSSQLKPQSLKGARWLTLWWGSVQIGVACGAVGLPSRVVDQALALTSFTNGPVLGLFLLGLTPARVTAPAATAGLFTGLAVVALVSRTGWLSWQWYTLLGAATTWATGVLFTLGGWLRSRKYRSFISARNENPANQ